MKFVFHSRPSDGIGLVGLDARPCGDGVWRSSWSDNILLPTYLLLKSSSVQRDRTSSQRLRISKGDGGRSSVGPPCEPLCRRGKFSSSLVTVSSRRVVMPACSAMYPRRWPSAQSSLIKAICSGVSRRFTGHPDVRRWLLLSDGHARLPSPLVTASRRRLHPSQPCREAHCCACRLCPAAPRHDWPSQN